jgi:hypothetical protein
MGSWLFTDAAFCGGFCSLVCFRVILFVKKYHMIESFVERKRMEEESWQKLADETRLEEERGRT